MTLADLIRRRQAFLALSNSDQWSEDEACRLFGLVPGSLNADGIFDMAAKDAEGIADYFIASLAEYAKTGNHAIFPTEEFCNDRR